MKALTKKHASKIRFAIVGSINTVIDFGILFLLHGVGLNKYVANIISTSIAFVFSFFANRNFTFKSEKNIRQQIIPFIAVTLVGLWVLQPAVIWLMLLPLADIDQTVALFIAKLGATAASLIWNYAFYSKVVFK